MNADRTMPYSLVIRPYRSEDWPRLCEIHDAARLDELRLSVGLEAFLTLEQAAPGEGLFDGRLDVAEIDGQVAGFVAYTGDYVTWLYVDPARYRSGIGRTLLRHAVANGGPVMGTSMLEGNEPALQLYLSEGFVITERREGKLAGNESFPAVGYELERRAEGT